MVMWMCICLACPPPSAADKKDVARSCANICTEWNLIVVALWLCQDFGTIHNFWT